MTENYEMMAYIKSMRESYEEYDKTWENDSVDDWPDGWLWTFDPRGIKR